MKAFIECDPERLYNAFAYADAMNIKELVGQDISVTSHFDRVVFTKHFDNPNPSLRQKRCIQFHTPFVEIHEPEKFVATNQTAFKVLEYSKVDAYTRKEVDEYRFKNEFIKCLEELMAYEIEVK